MPLIYIYGPPGSGKTRYAEALRKKYGCSRIVDGYTGGQVPPDSLVLGLRLELAPQGASTIPIQLALRGIVPASVKPQLSVVKAEG